MSIRDWLILASFVLGMIPLAVLAGRYAWLGNWRSSSTGRAFMYLFLVFLVWAGLSVITLIWPDQMRGEVGEWIRITIRFATDGVLWNVLRVFLKAQTRTAGVPTPATGIPVGSDE